MKISRRILPKMRNFSDKRCTENHNTYFMLNNFFPTSCLVRENMEKYDREKQATDTT